MSKEILAASKELLMKHRMPTNALPQMWEAMRTAKSGIDSMLGLTEETQYRFGISLERSEEEVRKSFPQTYAVIGHLLNLEVQKGAAIDLSTISLVNNSVMVKGQPGKLSRLLSRQLKGQESVLDHCMKELSITKHDQFLPKLGDIVRSGRKLFISTNLYDFLTASGTESGSYASFSSCHGPGGCHYNGNLAYGRDNMTVITFVTDDKADIKNTKLFKLGRSWMFIVKDNIVQTKSYGAYHAFEREAARKFVEEKIAKQYGIANSFSLAHNVGYDEDNFFFEEAEDSSGDDKEGALYFDNYAIDVSYPSNRSFLIPDLNFAAAMCLECGCTTDNPSKGVCTEHDGKIKATCAGCGQRHLADNMYSHGEDSYCSTCYHERFTQCSHCGNYHPKAEIEDIKGYHVCPACKESRYATCACCGTFDRKDRLNDMKGLGHVCDECRDKYMLCGICGEYHLKEDVEYYRHIGRMCKKCLASKAFTCGCGEVFLNTDKKGELCPICEANALGKELVLKDKPKYADLPEGWNDYTEIVG